MTYLLSQPFWWLVSASLFFFVLGWLIRGRFTPKGADTSVTDIERAGWQASLDSQRAQFEAKLDALGQQISEKNDTLGERGILLSQLRFRIADLEVQAGSAQALREESGALKAQIATLSSQNIVMEMQLMRVGELENQLSAVAQENVELKTQVAELTPKLAMAAAAGAGLQQAWPRDQHVLPQADRDDLKKIYGIGPVLEKRLNELGVYFFREIAMWTKEDILRFESHLKEFHNRIERDNWVEGARQEHLRQYGEELGPR